MSGFVEIYPEKSTQSSQPKQTRTQYINKYMKQKRANETQSPEAKEREEFMQRNIENVNRLVRVPNP